jgi:ribosomal protein L11 methyltransferase
MSWLALTLELEEAAAEAFSDALIEAGAVSVALEDADAGSDAETPYFAEPSWDAPAAWRRNRLSALIETDADPAGILGAAARAAGLAKVPAYSVARVADQDWVHATQAHIVPLTIGGRLWVGPSWHEPPGSEFAVVRLDPGLAFGTGSHATTRLALEFLVRTLAGGERILDYGCGSGILAVAAAKLGAAQVDAVDLDRQALEAAAVNASANCVAVRVFAPEALPPGDYDVVVANILAKPLMLLSPLLAARTRAGGRLALSGILVAQAEELAAAYAERFDLAVTRDEEGWVLLEGTRR